MLIDAIQTLTLALGSRSLAFVGNAPALHDDAFALTDQPLRIARHLTQGYPGGSRLTAVGDGHPRLPASRLVSMDA